MSLVYFAVPTFAVEKKISDGTLATANGIVITQDDFDKEMERTRIQFARNGKPLS